jgi:hypothetical protein
VALQPPLPSELCQLDYSTSEDMGSVVSARRKPARVKTVGLTGHLTITTAGVLSASMSSMVMVSVAVS